MAYIAECISFIVLCCVNDTSALENSIGKFGKSTFMVKFDKLVKASVKHIYSRRHLSFE